MQVAEVCGMCMPWFLLLAAKVAITNIQTDWSAVIACSGTIFSAERYGHAFMVTVNALLIIFCGWHPHED